MKLAVGNIWSAYETSDLFLVTTNGVVTKDGRLVMGRGLAKEALQRFPGLDRSLAQAIREQGQYLSVNRLYVYGLLVSAHWPQTKLGGFQVKYHWKESADLELISTSCIHLARWAQQHPDAHIDLNYPGIGNGRLDEREVEPMIRALPDTVTIWKKGNK